MTFAVGGHSELIYARGDRSARLVPSHLLELLHRCRTFATLDEHARERCRELGFGPEHIEPMKRELSRLAEGGLLVAHSELLGRCRGAAALRPAPPAIASVGFVTRSRVESLSRAVRSYIENGARYGRTHDFVVMDDTEGAETREGCRQMLASLKARHGVAIHYAGAEEKRRFADALIRDTEAPPDVVNFALFDVEQCGYSPGANHNALLLHTVGDIFFGADDDTVCRVAPSPESPNRLRFFSGYDPTEFSFFPDHAAALRAVAFAETDLLAAHETLLGRELCSCLAALGASGGLDIDQMNPGFARTLAAGDGKVLVTLTGLVGDCGMGAPTWYLSRSGASRTGLIRSEADYRAALRSRQVLRMVSQPTVSEGVFCMTFALGLDNRALLPPFLPVGRNQDGVFGVILRRCFEAGYFAHLPLAILHAPLPPRAFTPDAIVRSASSVIVADILMACAASAELGPGRSDAPARLRALGRTLMELGTVALPDFEEYVRLRLWHRKSAEIVWLEGLLESFAESPDFWANDVKQYLAALRDAMQRDDYLVPRDLRHGRSLEDARGLTQRLVLGFGQLLLAWPEMVEAARTLRARGHGLARAL